MQAIGSLATLVQIVGGSSIFTCPMFLAHVEDLRVLLSGWTTGAPTLSSD